MTDPEPTVKYRYTYSWTFSCGACGKGDRRATEAEAEADRTAHRERAHHGLTPHVGDELIKKEESREEIPAEDSSKGMSGGQLLLAALAVFVILSYLTGR